MPNIIDSIQISSSTFDVRDKSATTVVNLTQEEYDNLPSSAKTANVLYNITDATAGDLSQYWTSAQTQSAITEATSGKADTIYVDQSVSGKVDTTTFNTYSGNVETALSGKQDTLSAGTNITIVDNVISAEGGGGKAVSGGTNISVTTGETADTINCTLPFSYEGDNLKTTVSGNSFVNYFHYGQIFGINNTLQGKNSATGTIEKNTTIVGYNNQSLKMDDSIVIGSSNKLGNIFGINYNNYVFGFSNTVNPVNTQDNLVNNNFVIGNNNTINQKSNNFIFGYGIKPSNNDEFSLGKYNNSVSGSSTFGDSGNTLFSVGNGTADNSRHNAFEIRQNGDIYLTLDGQDVKLQDQLGGGGGGITSGEVQSMIDESISGKTDESAFTAHTADTTIHVTAQDKTNWNNKSDFSGDYNDLTNKPTIPTVPTNVSDFTNDAGYITSNDISGKTNQSDFTAHTADTTIHVTSTEKAAWNAKSDFSGSYNDLTNKLSAGTNITIVDNVISATGGGSITIDPTLDSGSTNAVANSAITTALNDKQIYNSSGYFYDVTTSYQNSGGKNTDYIRFKAYKNDGSTTNVTKLYFPRINGNKLVNLSAYYTDFQLLEKSAVTSAITSSSTDAQVPSAKAVNDKLGGLSLVKLTQAEYDALATKDSNTLYVING